LITYLVKTIIKCLDIVGTCSGDTSCALGLISTYSSYISFIATIIYIQNFNKRSLVLSG